MNKTIPNITQAIITRLYKNGFIPRTFLSFNPHQTNCSQAYLAYNLRKSLKKYYSQPAVFGRDFNKHIEEQYKLVIFIENGELRDFEKHPHLHILTELSNKEALNFYCFLIYSLQNYYSYMTGQLLNVKYTPQDLLNVWGYCDKEQREFDSGQSKYGNVMLTHKNLQTPMEYDRNFDKLQNIQNWFRDCQ